MKIRDIEEYGMWPDQKESEPIAKSLSGFGSDSSKMKKVGSIETFDIYHRISPTKNHYIHVFHKKNPIISFAINETDHDFGYPFDPMAIWAVYASPEYRKTGLAYKMYRWILNNITDSLIIGGGLTKGSQRIWAKLADEINVYAYNSYEDEPAIKKVDSQTVINLANTSYDLLATTRSDIPKIV